MKTLAMDASKSSANLTTAACTSSVYDDTARSSRPAYPNSASRHAFAIAFGNLYYAWMAYKLAGYEKHWAEYPIYVKATAGMRELPEKKRDGIVNAVRALLASNETCPFDFANKEQARVIAGEEEAAFAWVAVNFVDGALLAGGAAKLFVDAPPNRELPVDAAPRGDLLDSNGLIGSGVFGCSSGFGG